MPSDYFQHLNSLTQTRFWVNNPTAAEMERALQSGAVSCTTNPAYCARLIEQEPEYMRRVIDETILEAATDERDEFVLAQEVCKRVTKRLIDAMEPVFSRSGGGEGFVTLQEDPRRDQDTNFIVDMARTRRKLGGNYMAKIPVIAGGIEAIEACVLEGIPVCATEVFSIAQAMDICAVYEKACARSGKFPAFFVTHITGIFDEYLGKVAAREGTALDPDVMRKAGLTIARKEYRLLQERGYRAVMLGGGARGTHHFTGLVGGGAHITINWSTAEEILTMNPEIENTIAETEDVIAVSKLLTTFPDFAKAYDEQGLARAEYAEFGPVQLFRNAFLKGWYRLLSEIAARKNALAL